jgi:autotransporter-associated beta strand protein
MFKGVWTPLTSKTKIGRDWNGNTVDAGEFYFKTKFSIDSSNADDPINNYSVSNLASNQLDNDDLGDSGNPNSLENRLNGLTSDTLIGIRFYDTTTASSGVSKFNTIMDTNWDWGTAGSNEQMSLHNSDGSASTSLYFEFDNDSASSVSKIGTSDTTINSLTNGDFVTTVTYFDGDETINVGDSGGGIGSTVFSGFDGTGLIYGGQDANIVTLHSQSGNTGADAYDFEGDFYRASGGTDSTDLTILKTGTGDQILSGNLNLVDSDASSASGGLNIVSGNLILKPASGKTQVVEYLTGAGGLKLDNSGVNDGTIVTLGFANQTSSTFSGTVVLDGNGAAGEAKIKVSKYRDESGFVDSDFGDTQTLSGVISNANGNKTMVKDGTGTLELTNTNTFSGGVRIEDGTLIAGNSQALGNTSNTITINKGKLEVANSVTLNSGYTVTTSTGTDKTMVGGRGDLNGNITIGSATTAGFVDVISPGDGISSSLTNNQSLQQVSLGSRTNAIGEFTVGALTLENGGVYDWEVSDFTNAGDDTKAGVDWDLLKFDSLTFDHTTDTITLNIMGLASDGTAGTMGGSAGNVWNSYQGTNGFLFMEGTWTGAPSAGTLSSGFTIQDDGWQHYNSHHLNEWSVYWDGTDSFYLQYSAVPEPSTYMMVTGLLMVPGMSYLRRIRRKKDSDQEETSL